jgi:C1A family cysteine protease
MARPRRVKRILNVEPSQNTERDWRLEHARDAGVLPVTRAALPSSKDLREPSWWKIGDQGSTGSCVGWASGDSLLRWHFVKAGRMAKDHRLSPRYLWMASKETDTSTSQPTTFIESSGTSLKSALDIARKFGAVRDSILPFASGKLYGGQAKTFYAVASQLRIGSYFNLSLEKGHDLEDWRTWLANKGPIMVRLDVDRTWDDARAAQGKLDVYRPETTRGGHAVALVGYTPDRFIVRNSWGTSWGDQGFGYASLAYAQDAFTDAYGVSL